MVTTHDDRSPRRREIHDSRGRLLGRLEGPDPERGGLGLEVELAPETRRALDARATRVWVPERWILAVRRDRIVLDRTRQELGRILPAATPAVDDVAAPGSPLQA